MVLALALETMNPTGPPFFFEDQELAIKEQWLLDQTPEVLCGLLRIKQHMTDIRKGLISLDLSLPVQVARVVSGLMTALKGHCLLEVKPHFSPLP